MIDVRGYLDSKGFKYKERGEEFNLCCPLCSPPDKEWKFFINATSGAWKCHHASRCGKQGNLYQLQRELGDVHQGNGKSAMTLTKNYAVPRTEGIQRLDAEWQAWWTARGITAETVERFKVRQKGSQLLFPYLRDGKLINLKTRDRNKNFMLEKGADICLFGRDLVPMAAEDLVVVEGEPDAMAAWEYGVTAVSVPSGAEGDTWVSREWEYLERFKRLFICFDSDEAGQKGAEKLIKRLGWQWEIHTVQLPYKDMNDCLQAGVPAEDIAEAIAGAQEARPSEIKTLGEIDMTDVAPPAHGIPCEIPGLDEALGGWRPNEITVIGGENFSGKSTAVLQEAAGCLRRFKRVFIASFEIKVTSVIFDLTRQLDMSREEFKQAFAEDLVFLDAFGGDLPTVQELVEKMTYVARRYSPDLYVIDSLGCLKLAISDRWLLQQEAVGHLARFAKDKETHVALVHHTRKFGRDSKGGPVSRYDLEGSAWISNLTDNVILLDRIEEEDRAKQPALVGVDEVLTLDKNRALGKRSRISLRFDPMSKRFEEART